MNIEVRKATDAEIKRLGARNWPTWSCEASSFEWSYDQKETCLILEGAVTVETDGKKIDFAAGDFVVFPKGLSCTWHVTKPVRKHYRFG